MITRGDVVLVYIPYIEVAGLGKRRPALVVQGDEHNRKRSHTIVAAITSKMWSHGDAAVHLLDPIDSEGQAAGVLMKSLIRCDRLFTVDQDSIARTIGHLAPGTMDRVEDCLRASLGLPPQAQPSMGNYETWIGFLKLKDRLEFFQAALNLNVTGHGFLSIEIQPARDRPIQRFWGSNLQLILPTKKQEFKDTGHGVRLTFQVTDEDIIPVLRELAPMDLEKYAMHRISLWAYSGPGNSLTCIYNAQCLNEGSREVYLLSLSEGVFEIGFDASGNLFDALLMSDQLSYAGSDKQPPDEAASSSDPRPTE